MRSIKLPEENRLPSLKHCERKDYDSKYLPIMNELGLSDPTKEEVDVLRNMVSDRIIEISDRYVKQGMMDIMQGKKELKMFRYSENPMERVELLSETSLMTVNFGFVFRYGSMSLANPCKRTLGPSDLK